MFRALRVLAAMTLLGLLAYGVDWQSMPGYLAALSWPAALLALGGLSAQFVVSPCKWQWALRIHQLHYDLSYLIRAYGIGFFFNNFLPSAIGGDAYRVMSTWPSDGRRSRAVSAVLVERIVGCAALLVFGNLGALALLDESPLAVAFVALSVAGAVGAGALAWATYAGWLKPVTDRIRHTTFFDAISHNLRYLKAGGRQWLALAAFSLLFQALAVAIIYMLFRSLAAPVPLAACALIGAAAGLAAVVPLSINGLGVVEGSFAGTAVALGVEYSVAFTVSLLIRILVLPATVAFGLMYALGSRSSPTPANTAAGILRVDPRG